MQQYEEYEEDEFQQSGGGWWIRLVGIVIYIAIIIAYAIQTMQLVGWLLASDNWFMKGVTVFVCDGCATGYAMAEMFYRFKLRRSKHIVFGMWVVTFILSTAASVIQMYLSSTHNIPHNIDTNIIALAYGLIIAAFVANIIAITVIIRMEHNAGKPAQRYLDDGRRKRRPVPASQSVQVAQTATVPPALPSPTPKEVTGHLQAAPRADSTPVPEFGTDEFKAWWKKYTGSDNPWKEGEDSPLARPAALHQNGHVTPEKPKE